MVETAPPIPKMSISEKLRYGAEAALFFSFIGLFRILGLDGASALGGFLGRKVLYRTGLSKRARDNLVKAYPEKSSQEVEAILMEMWENLGIPGARRRHPL